MKRIITIALAMLIMLLAACGGDKTVTSREKVKELTEDFYGVLGEADNYKLSTYYNDELTSVLTKEQDKMHMEVVDEEYGYDYFMFMEDGKKYVVTEDRSLVEDESTYDLAAETIDMMLDMSVYAYLDEDIEGITYSATPNGDSELVTVVQGKNEGTDFTITMTGKKEDNNITEIVSEMKFGDETSLSKYEFSYDEHVEIPEYSVGMEYRDLPHVDSPYKTFGEIIEKLGEEDFLNCMFTDDSLVVIDEKDGRHYQFSSVVSQDVLDKYGELDIMNDDYETQVRELISGIEIEDCIDFTDELLSQDEAAAYIGGNIKSMIDAGFETSGYSFYEGNNYIYETKDSITYSVEVELPEGFDPEGEFEYEDLDDAVVKGIEFESVEPAALPMS